MEKEREIGEEIGWDRTETGRRRKKKREYERETGRKEARNGWKGKGKIMGKGRKEEREVVVKVYRVGKVTHTHTHTARVLNNSIIISNAVLLPCRVTGHHSTLI